MTVEIKCSSCGQLLPIDKFSKDRRSKSGRSCQCKTCRGKSNKAWHLENREHVVEFRKARALTPDGIWERLKGHKKDSGVRALIIDKEAFLSWYEKQKKCCAYCGMTLDDFAFVSRVMNVQRKATRLEIDRMNSELPYQSGNLVLACRICNYHKSNFFTHEEFLRIGRTYLRPKFLAILRLRPSGKAGSP